LEVQLLTPLTVIRIGCVCIAELSESWCMSACIHTKGAAVLQPLLSSCCVLQQSCQLDCEVLLMALRSTNSSAGVHTSSHVYCPRGARAQREQQQLQERAVQSHSDERFWFG
jgi:hypothetical protein